MRPVLVWVRGKLRRHTRALRRPRLRDLLRRAEPRVHRGRVCPRRQARGGEGHRVPPPRRDTAVGDGARVDGESGDDRHRLAVQHGRRLRAPEGDRRVETRGERAVRQGASAPVRRRGARDAGVRPSRERRGVDASRLSFRRTRIHRRRGRCFRRRRGRFRRDAEQGDRFARRVRDVLARDEAGAGELGEERDVLDVASRADGGGGDGGA
mmetsp:Transcript_3720/g.16328  ORF Transcript_3720/g.16328 Transcript_3720/m.16328 type:complete len:210 (-) Transcript_3720:428-1057(-)